MKHNAARFWIHDYPQLIRLLTTIIIPVLLFVTLAYLLVIPNTVNAAVTDVEVTIIAAPNLIVDSNVLSSSTQAPEVATVIGRFCNTSNTTLNNIVGYIGDYDSGTPSNSTPGIYPSKTNVTIGGQLYSGTYRFLHLGGRADAIRIIGTLTPDQCSYQYWSFQYPNTANGGTIPTWGGSVQPNDDLFLDFDIWAAEAGTLCNAAICSENHVMTIRNEISAMANKIEPNGNPGGQWFNTNDQTVNVGETITTNGILYRIGNVNQGFDNDGDLVPDYNAWLQPIGNPTYDPSCFRLIEASGVLTVTRSAGNPDLVIPFNHELNQQNNTPLLYFTDLPTDNTDVRGLVYYTFMALGGPCTIPISPYQEVASGSDNEKFNGDYGGGGPGTIETYPPSLNFDKNGPTTATEGGAAFTYSIPFQNIGASSMGLSLSSGLNAGFVISDMVPDGLQYVGGSAPLGNTVPSGNNFIIYYSTNSGLTWTTTDPGTVTSSAPNNLVQIQWWLTEPLQASQSGAVTFQAQVPGGYIAGGGDPFIENCADARLGTGSPLAEACTITMVQGNNALGDTVWSDNGAGGGLSNNGLQDGTELGIANVTVTLYWDRDGDGLLDPTDPQVGMTTSNGTGIYGFSNLPDARYIVVVDAADTDLPTGYGPTTPKQYAIDLDSAGISGTGITNNTADFGFGPALTVDKALISSNPAYEGDNVTFRIGLTNNLPGNGTVGGFCQYTIWATIAHPTTGVTPPGGGPANAQWSNPNNALGVPNLAISATNLDDNTDTLGLSGFNIGNQGGNITDVDVVIYVEEIDELSVNDEFEVQVYYGDATLGTAFILNGGQAPFTGPMGNFVTVRHDIDNILRPGLWTWADFRNNQTELQLTGDNGAGASGDLGVDAVAYVVTTDQLCGGADSTITTLPMTDTYDADLLQFVAATPGHTTVSTAGTPPNSNGTVTWSNLGPLYAGQTKYVTVTFKALDPNSQTAINTINTAVVTNAKFGNGRDVNDDSDTADVNINPTGSISGVVYSDGNNNGWQGTTGYENLGTTDFGIPNATVSLYGCYNADPTTGGTLFTDVATNASCTGQVGGSADNWYLIATTTTTSNGSYTFSGLRMGYYYVQVNAATLPAGATQNAEAGTAANNQNGTGRTCGTCDHIWGSPTANLDPISFFNPIGSGDPLVNGNENITNVNFGYNNVPATIYGRVWFDENGDGDQDSGEGGITGATVRRCADVNCTTILATTTTGADGRYSFTGVTPGTYYVQVVQPANTTQTGDPDQNGTCTICDNRTTTTIVLTAGEHEGSFDFGYRPSGAFSIGDTLYRDWDGDGTQDSGEEGLPNITVYLYEDEDNDGVIDPEDAIMGIDVTDGNGVYSFDNLPDGNYVVVVDTSDADYPSNHTQTGDPDGVCPGVVCDDISTSAAIAGANDNDNDFGYQPTGFASIGDYIWNDLDGDGNQDANEPAINNVTVRLYQDQDGDGVIDPEDALVAITNTSGGGVYNFANLYPSNYIVAIDPAEFNPGGDLEGLTLTSTGAPYTNTASQTSYLVVLGAGQIFTDADFGFAEGIIGDFIWRDNNGNGTPDPGEPGISGVTVTLYNDVNGNGVYDAGTDTFRVTTTTDSSGLYEFGSLPGGDYVVVVTPPVNYTLTGDPDAYSTNPAVAAYPPCSTTNPVYLFCDHQYGVDLRTGQVDRTADFGYRPLGVIGDTLWIDGDNDGIRDNGEAGIPFITVNLCSALPCTGGNIVATTTTDSDGYYSFGGLANGTYFVQPNVTDPDFPAGLTQTYDPDGTLDNIGNNIVMAGGVVTSINGVGCTNCDLNIDFGYRFTGNNTISGTLWHDDDSGGAPGGTGDIDPSETYRYSNVTVYLWNCGAGSCTDGDEVLAGTTTTNGTGQYSFTNLANGTYAVTVNPNSPSLAGASPTTPTGYIGGSDPNVVLSGGTNAQRDFGFLSTMDFGDLPSSYNNTLSAENGARHLMGTVYLGTAVEADPDGQENAAATGDIDEGVAVTGTWTNGANGGSVTVTAQCPTSPCYLSGWVDWNADGDFNDSGERIFLDQTVNSGPNALTFNIPSGTFSPSGPSLVLNARFRIYAASTGGFAQPTGYVVNGEVEDYQWQFGPTAIGLITWQAAYSNPAAAIIITFTLLLLTTGIILYRRAALNQHNH